MIEPNVGMLPSVDSIRTDNFTPRLARGMTKMARNTIEIADDDEPVRGREVDLKDKPKRKPESDDEMFDPLDRNIVFPDDEELEEEEEDEDEVEDSDEEEESEDEDDSEDREDRRANKKSDAAKRLARERRLKDEARDEADGLRENFKALEKEFANLKQVVESGTSEKEIDAKVGTITAELTKLKAEKVAAIEAGDSAKVADIDDKIIDARSELKMLENKKVEAKKAAEAAARAKPVTNVQNRHLTKWLRSHGKTYRSDGVFKAAADATEKTVASDGYAPDTEDYYEEISKRLAKRFPEEFPDLKQGKQKRRRPPVENDSDDAPATRRDRKDREVGGIKVRGNKAYLTPQNIKTMKAVGMDPSDPEDVKIFVRENVQLRK